MFPSIDPAGQQFLNAMDTIQKRLDIAQQEVSTGLKVTQPSDAPDQLSPILAAHAAIQANQDAQTRLGSAQAEVNAGAQALSGSVDLLQQASVLASQGTGPDQTAGTRATLAQNVAGILQQMVANSRTSVEGRYVFSGDQDQSPQYQVDPNTGAVDRLQISASTRLVQDASGAQYSIARSGNDIFDHRDANDQPAPDNVFNALSSLQAALASDNTDGIKAAISSLQTASTYLNSQLSFYGQAQSRVTASVSQAQTSQVQLQSNLSRLQDADVTQAITQLTESQTQMQAALAARARMPQTTLFDVLPAPTA